ncbi:hypothetical protein GCM10009102_07690 [Sphingomonas insulae]|uniref:Transposase n=1 Tax=Sphingomonas insulae TaxID=424800 RepID=A0ABP3SV64_9SPHN
MDYSLTAFGLADGVSGHWFMVFLTAATRANDAATYVQCDPAKRRAGRLGIRLATRRRPKYHLSFCAR